MCTGSRPVAGALDASRRTAERRRFAVALNEAGLARTRQRATLYEVLLEANDHICVEHLLARARALLPDLRLNKTTIYRNMEHFIQLGLVRQIQGGDARAQFEPAWLPEQSHLMCAQCGVVEHLGERETAHLAAGARARGFTLDLVHVPLLGICADCRARPSEGPR
jgi:Fe2+ or Zn2+ uptake regulation protein